MTDNFDSPAATAGTQGKLAPFLDLKISSAYSHCLLLSHVRNLNRIAFSICDLSNCKCVKAAICRFVSCKRATVAQASNVQCPE